MSQNKIYVGNLSYDVNKDDLQQEFSKFGTIDEINLIIDRDTGRSKGFGFITFSSQSEADASLEMNGQQLLGRSLKVNIAKAKEQGGSRDRRY